MNIENIKKAGVLIKEIQVSEATIERIKKCKQIRLADSKNSMDCHPFNAVDIRIDSTPELDNIIEEFKSRLIDYHKDMIIESQEQLKEL